MLLASSTMLVTSVSVAQTIPTDSVRDSYREFIMPTGKPIEGGYIGAWELAFLQAGYGFGDFLSVSGGFTAMPTVAFRSQFGYLQAKLTLFDDQGFTLAGGLNLLRLTSDNLFLHLFGSLTYQLDSGARVTGMIFYKIYTSTPEGSNNTLIEVNVVPYGSFLFNYTGGLGGGLGFDTPLAGNKNVRFVSEVWDLDLTTLKLGIIGALRLESDNFSSDFGLMYFTLPLLAPVANFVWRF
jgi:hypothetical protein